MEEQGLIPESFMQPETAKLSTTAAAREKARGGDPACPRHQARHQACPSPPQQVPIPGALKTLEQDPALYQTTELSRLLWLSSNPAYTLRDPKKLKRWVRLPSTRAPPQSRPMTPCTPFSRVQRDQAGLCLRRGGGRVPPGAG